MNQQPAIASVLLVPIAVAIGPATCEPERVEEQGAEPVVRRDPREGLLRDPALEGRLPERVARRLPGAAHERRGHGHRQRQQEREREARESEQEPPEASGHEGRARAKAEHHQRASERAGPEPGARGCPCAGAPVVLLCDPRAERRERRGEEVPERAGYDHCHPHPCPRGELLPAVDEVVDEPLPLRAYVPREPQERERDGTHREAGGVNGHGPSRGGGNHQDPRGDRPGDSRDRVRDGTERIRILEQLEPDCEREQPGRRRIEEPCGRPGHRLEDEELPDLGGPGDQQRRGQRESARTDDVRDDHQPLPRDTVGNDAAREDREHERRARRREDEPDVGDRAGEIEHREREREQEHRVAEDGDRLAAPEERVLALPEDAGITVLSSQIARQSNLARHSRRPSRQCGSSGARFSDRSTEYAGRGARAPNSAVVIRLTLRVEAGLVEDRLGKLRPRAIARPPRRDRRRTEARRPRPSPLRGARRRSGSRVGRRPRPPRDARRRAAASFARSCGPSARRARRTARSTPLRLRPPRRGAWYGRTRDSGAGASDSTYGSPLRPSKT